MLAALTGRAESDFLAVSGYLVPVIACDFVYLGGVSLAKSDKTRQSRELSIEQLNAIDYLVSGVSDAEVADAVGVSRQTVCDWRNKDLEFAAALERKRQDIWRGHEDIIRALISQSVCVLKQSLSSEDERIRMAAAVHVLRCVGLYGHSLEPVGDTTADAIALRNWSMF